MHFLNDLEERGWVLVPGISSSAELLELAKSIGSPTPSPSGELVKKIGVISEADATPGTLSATFGTKSFPLHTDTAFWAIPARYLILRVRGDTRRHTTVLPFQRVFQGGGQARELAERSVWFLRTPSISAYCSMGFSVGRFRGWRYDRQCMFPVNRAAHELVEVLGPLEEHGFLEQVNWSPGVTVVISNWKVLHGRGPEPVQERERVLERIYVG